MPNVPEAEVAAMTPLTREMKTLLIQASNAPGGVVEADTSRRHVHYAIAAGLLRYITARYRGKRVPLALTDKGLAEYFRTSDHEALRAAHEKAVCEGVPIGRLRPGLLADLLQAQGSVANG